MSIDKKIKKLFSDLESSYMKGGDLDNDLKESLIRIWSYTSKLVNEEITILDVATKANKEMEIISWLSQNYADKFKRRFDNLNTIKIIKLIEMLKTFNMEKEESKEPENVDDANDKEEVTNHDQDDYQDKYLRLYAEFDNYKKRVTKEKQMENTKARYQVLSPFLDIIDELEMAKSAISNQSQDNTGLDLILNKIDKYLDDQKIVEIDTNCKFDSNIHECITVIDMGSDKSGDIIEVIKKGYLMNNKIVRYPKVVVGK